MEQIARFSDSSKKVNIKAADDEKYKERLKQLQDHQGER